MRILLVTTLLAAGPAYAVTWLRGDDFGTPGRRARYFCAPPVAVSSLRESLDAGKTAALRSVVLDYPDATAGNQADLVIPGGLAMKLRRYTLTREMPTNVVSIFDKRRTWAPSAPFEEHALALARTYSIFEPLANDPRAPTIDPYVWIKLRGLETWDGRDSPEFIQSVHQDIEDYARSSRWLRTWDQVRSGLPERGVFAPVLRSPFVVFALNDVSLILSQAMTQVAVCLPIVRPPTPEVTREVLRRWFEDAGVRRLLGCTASLLR